MNAATKAAPGRADLKVVILVPAALLVLAVLPFILPTYQVSVATQILIFAVLAMSIDVLAGYAGRTSLCHGAIFGVSTYVVLYGSTVAGLPVLASMVVGVLAATVLAAVFGVLAVRTSGVYFLLLTLA
ncbi:MAG TPA: hypothetical protein VIG64_06445, partial [Actinomycetota bacterium]